MRRMFNACEEGKPYVVVAGPQPCSLDPWADRRSCPWLLSLSRWKAAVQPAANVLHEVLYDADRPHYCTVCEVSVANFAKHLFEARHWQQLCDKVPDGRPVVASGLCLWQQWDLPDGLVRFNHLHGQVELSRGSPDHLRPTMFRRSSPSPSRRKLTWLSGLPGAESLDNYNCCKERHALGHSRHQVDWDVFPYLELEGEPSHAAVKAFAWRLWLEHVWPKAWPLLRQLRSIWEMRRPFWCSLCNSSMTLDQLPRHLRSRRHFAALLRCCTQCQSPTQQLDTAELLELDHLQLHISGGASAPSSRQLEVEEFAWRLWREHVASPEAAEFVQEMLQQHEVFEESMVCGLCSENMGEHVADHLRSPNHFRRLLWWLFQGDLMTQPIFRPGAGALIQSFQAFHKVLRLDHVQMHLTRANS
ncbi:unnamed protein product [Effrenium voratum]|nr:unnamed protein product [Effrenium voratum]